MLGVTKRSPKSAEKWIQFTVGFFIGKKPRTFNVWKKLHRKQTCWQYLLADGVKDQIKWFPSFCKHNLPFWLKYGTFFWAKQKKRENHSMLWQWFSDFHWIVVLIFHMFDFFWILQYLQFQHFMRVWFRKVHKQLPEYDLHLWSLPTPNPDKNCRSGITNAGCTLKWNFLRRIEHQLQKEKETRKGKDWERKTALLLSWKRKHSMQWVVQRQWFCHKMGHFLMILHFL